MEIVFYLFPVDRTTKIDNLDMLKHIEETQLMIFTCLSWLKKIGHL